MTTTISSKGQIVIPKAVRACRSIRAGDDIEVLVPEGTEDIILRKVGRKPNEGLLIALRKMRGLEIAPRSGRPGRTIKL